MKEQTAVPYAYAPGATLALAMIRMRPQAVRGIRVLEGPPRERLHDAVLAEAERLGLPVTSVRAGMPRPGEKYYSVGAVYETWEDQLRPGSHVVLVSPGDPRNAGAVMRSALAFGIHDVAVIAEAFDSFSPEIGRASMGSRARLRVERFDGIGDYLLRFPLNTLYAFMPDAARPLGAVEKQEPFSLIFGNELTGLPPEYAGFCEAVAIEQSNELDSLNLSVAAGIALYSFTRLKAAKG